MKKIKAFISRRKWLSIFIALIVLVIVLLIVFKKNSNNSFATAIVSNQNIFEEVVVTGKVAPIQSANLSFDRAGKVKKISVSVGESVKKDQILASLDVDELYASLNASLADLSSEEIKLRELIRGTRSEELMIYNGKYESADATYKNAESNLQIAVRDTYGKISDAIRNYSDVVFDNPASANPTIKTGIVSISTDKIINDKRQKLTTSLNIWSQKMNQSKTSFAEDGVLDIAEKVLSDTKEFIEILWNEVSTLTATRSSLDVSTINLYLSNVSSARNNINTASIALSSALSSFKTAEAGLNVSAQELELATVGNSTETIDIQRSKVEKARASVEMIRSQINHTLIKAPFDGIVSKIEPKEGEVFPATVNAISVIDDSVFKIEVNVPEVDIAHMSIGNKAKITLDAYGKDKIFDATVNMIDPAEIIFEGIPSYKVTLVFVRDSNQPKESILSGMTANIKIESESRNVLAIPHKAIMGTDGNRYVKVNKNGKAEDVPIKIGIRGANGYTEIISGLSEGDSILIP